MSARATGGAGGAVPPTDDSSTLVSLLGELLVRQEERLCFLFGSGMVAPCVPGVAGVVEAAAQWTGSARSQPLGTGRAPHAREYGRALASVASRFQLEGQQAFLQRLALDAYRGPEAGRLRERLERTRSPLADHEFRALEDELDAWRIPAGVAAFAALYAARSSLPRAILTTNFDPLLEIALRREAIEVRTLTAAADTNPLAERTAPATVTVMHLHGDCYLGRTLHTRADVRQRRGTVSSWLRAYLRDKQLVVVGYSGWDDVVKRTVVDCIRSNEPLRVMWAVSETGPDELEAANPHLSHLLAETHPQAVAYHGVDRDHLFPALRASAPRPRRRAVRRTGAAPNEFRPIVRTLTARLGFGRMALDLEREDAPRAVFWTQRLREPHLVHGVNALTAVLMSKAGLEVELHLDDIGIQRYRAEPLARDFARAVASWSRYLGAEPPPIRRYTEQLPTEEANQDALAELWAMTRRMDAAPVTLRDLLAAYRVLEPATFDLEPGPLARLLSGTLDLSMKGRLLGPLVAFFALGKLSGRYEMSANAQEVITLGDHEDRPLWALWQQMFPCSTGHLFTPRIDWVNQARISGAAALGLDTPYRTRDLERFVRHLPGRRDAAAMVAWLLDCCVRLPRYARDGAPPGAVRLGSYETVTAAEAVAALEAEPADAARDLAGSIGEWFYEPVSRREGGDDLAPRLASLTDAS